VFTHEHPGRNGGYGPETQPGAATGGTEPARADRQMAAASTAPRSSVTPRPRSLPPSPIEPVSEGLVALLSAETTTGPESGRIQQAEADKGGRPRTASHTAGIQSRSQAAHQQKERAQGAREASSWPRGLRPGVVRRVRPAPGRRAADGHEGQGDRGTAGQAWIARGDQNWPTINPNRVRPAAPPSWECRPAVMGLGPSGGSTLAEL